MRKLTLLLVLISSIGFSQTKNLNSKNIKTIRHIYSEFISSEEDTDSEDNKTAMTKAIKSLKDNLSVKEIDLLIEIWLQYDPMDFPTKDLVLPILKKNAKATLLEINKQLKKKIDTESSTFNDVTILKKAL